MMAKLKPGYDKALLHTQQQQPLTTTYAIDVCECLTTRNMCKTKIEPSSEVSCRRRRTRKLLYTQKPCHSIDSKGSFKALLLPRNTCSYPALHTSSLVSFRNLLQHLVGWLAWHVTASTAISIFAVLYYFIANTRGALAVFSATTTTTSSTPSASASASTSLSFSVLHASLTTPVATNSSIFQTPRGYNSNINGNIHGNSGDSSINFNNHNSSINNIYFNLFLDLNYNNNATEIAIANAVSSLPAATPASGFSFDINYNNSLYDYYNNVVTVGYNNGLSSNETFDGNNSEYIFDRTDVRVIFITLYTLVFCCCFFGNLLVMLVVTLSRRLRSITNFFLANLALADFCVGLFCVMQNLSIYLIESWVFGEFLCRMYQFVHSLSYAASIFILVVICVERYCAIVHPITCKQMLTASRLRIVISSVWILSALYSTPKFLFSTTIKNVHTASGREEVICVLDRKMFNSKILDMINFVFLYAVPLLVMTILYSKIAIALWRSSRGLQHHLAQQENSMGLHNSMYHNHNHRPNNNHNSQPQQNHHNHHHQHHHHHNLHNHHQQLSQQELNQQQHQHQQQQHQPSTSGPVGNSIAVNSSVVSGASLSRKQSCKYDGRHGVDISESQNDCAEVCLDDDRPVVSTCRKTSFYKHSHNHLSHQQQQQQTQPPAATTNHQRTHAQHHSLHGSQRVSHNISHSSNNVLRARRGVVRMLIIFVLTFALCNLPYHARKMWQYWSRSYRGDSNFNALLTPLTFLVTYFNSGINPLLYAFLSRNFRKGMKELLMCSWRKSKTKSSTNSSRHHKRMTMQTNSLPTDITHIGNEQL